MKHVPTKLKSAVPKHLPTKSHQKQVKMINIMRDSTSKDTEPSEFIRITETPGRSSIGTKFPMDIKPSQFFTTHT